MKNILLALHQQPIAFYPVYVDLTGSVTAGLLLSQVMYWNTKMKGNRFYKTDTSFMEETRLTQTEFKTAKKLISGLSFLSIERDRVTNRTYYDIDLDNLAETIDKFKSDLEVGSRTNTSNRGVNLRRASEVIYGGHSRLSTEGTVVNLPTIIGTEITTEITTENTTVVELHSTVTLIDEVDEMSVEIHHVPDYFEEAEKLYEKMKPTWDKEDELIASQQKTNPTPQFRETPRPKAKRAKVDDPTPIRAMFDLYADKYAELNNGVKPEFMVKYTPAMKNLYGILRSRSITSGFVPLDNLEPWRDFLTAWADYLSKNEKEKWHRDNFNPLTFFSQFNSIIAKLNNRPKTDAEKWMEWGKRQGL